MYNQSQKIDLYHFKLGSGFVVGSFKKNNFSCDWQYNM